MSYRTKQYALYDLVISESTIRCNNNDNYFLSYENLKKKNFTFF